MKAISVNAVPFVSVRAMTNGSRFLAKPRARYTSSSQTDTRVVVVVVVDLHEWDDLSHFRQTPLIFRDIFWESA